MLFVQAFGIFVRRLLLVVWAPIISRELYQNPHSDCNVPGKVSTHLTSPWLLDLFLSS